MRESLKFCYFFLVFIIISCGNSNSDKKESATSKNTENTPEENTAPSNAKTILFFGNSLTAGYGLDAEESFPSLIQDRLDSLQMNYQVVNAGLSGETTAGGKNRLDWVLNQEVDIFILELGANDGLRGVPLRETKNNLQAIIDKVKAKNEATKIVLAGMMIPPNMGQEYTQEFQTIFPDLAQENDIELIPFLLAGVGGNPDLNLADGIHPNVEGQKIVANNVWAILKGIL